MYILQFNFTSSFRITLRESGERGERENEKGENKTRFISHL